MYFDHQINDNKGVSIQFLTLKIDKPPKTWLWKMIFPIRTLPFSAPLTHLRSLKRRAVRSLLVTAVWRLDVLKSGSWEKGMPDINGITWDKQQNWGMDRMDQDLNMRHLEPFRFLWFQQWNSKGIEGVYSQQMQPIMETSWGYNMLYCKW